MELLDAVTLCVDDCRLLCGGCEEGCPRCEATDMLIKAFNIDEESLTPITVETNPKADLAMAKYREVLEPRLVHLIAGLRYQQAQEAVALLLDYIDVKASMRDS